MTFGQFRNRRKNRLGYYLGNFWKHLGNYFTPTSGHTVLGTVSSQREREREREGLSSFPCPLIAWSTMNWLIVNVWPCQIANLSRADFSVSLYLPIFRTLLFCPYVYPPADTAPIL